MNLLVMYFFLISKLLLFQIGYTAYYPRPIADGSYQVLLVKYYVRELW